MSTRDPRSHAPREPNTPASAGAREPTQSLRLEPGEQSPAAEFAFGTHNRQITSTESPNGRGKTPAPLPFTHTPMMPIRAVDVPDPYLDTVLGSYRVIEQLGKGGMGYVYRAEHVKLGREVALKLLRSDYASRRDAVARFFQEARTVNRVRHRNIVDVTDFVELDDGTTFIIMELLSGTSLGAWARGGIELPRALAVLIQICDGLAAAHQVGVVHRDLKPDNVIVVPTSDGADLVKLLDFGVAKLLNREDEDLGFQTVAGAVIGTPAYMSPEQAGGMEVDARSDIYSLGAIMYELFTGQPMFRGRSFGEYVRKHLTEIPVPPRQTPGGAQLDPQIEALILRCLDKDPDQRFAQIGELRDALLSLLGGMATQLPGGIATMTGSGIRPQVSQLRLPPHLMAYATSLGAQPSHLTGAQPLYVPGAQASPSQFAALPGAHASPSQLAAHSHYTPAPAPATAAPRWMWLAGGVVAVGLVAIAAIWFVGRGEPSLAPGPASVVATPTQAAAPAAAQPAPSPTAQPIEPPARLEVVEVRFDSLPSGSVFSKGQSAELCRTPCAFNIDLSDGGPTDRRAFVVKREGYADGEITVDLTGERREFHVLLQHDQAAAPPDVAPSDPPDSAKPAPPVVKDDPRPEKRPTKRTPKVTKTTKTDGKDTKDGATGRDVRETKDVPDPDRDRPKEPADDKPVPTKKPPTKPTIDPSDTLDPFHRK